MRWCDMFKGRRITHNQGTHKGRVLCRQHDPHVRSKGVTHHHSGSLHNFLQESTDIRDIILDAILTRCSPRLTMSTQVWSIDMPVRRKHRQERIAATPSLSSPMQKHKRLASLRPFCIADL